MERRSTAELVRALKQLEHEQRSLADDLELLADLDDLVQEAKDVRGGVEKSAVVR